MAPSLKPHELLAFVRVLIWMLLTLPTPSTLQSSGLTFLPLEQRLSTAREASFGQSLNQKIRSRSIRACLPPGGPKLPSTGGEPAAQVRAELAPRGGLQRTVCPRQGKQMR